MPSKHNAARRHRIPRTRYRVTNSLGALLRSGPVYEADLRRRGDLTLWLGQAALDGWAAPKRSTPGGQPSPADCGRQAAIASGITQTVKLPHCCSALS